MRTIVAWLQVQQKHDRHHASLPPAGSDAHLKVWPLLVELLECCLQPRPPIVVQKLLLLVLPAGTKSVQSVTADIYKHRETKMFYIASTEASRNYLLTQARAR